MKISSGKAAPSKSWRSRSRSAPACWTPAIASSTVRRAFEVLAEQLQVGAGLLDARDRQVDRPQRSPDVVLQRAWKLAGVVLAPPGLPNLRSELQEPNHGRAGHRALVWIRQQTIHRLVEGADQPP